MDRSEDTIHELAHRVATGEMTVEEYRSAVDAYLTSVRQEVEETAPARSAGPDSAEQSGDVTVDERLSRVEELLKNASDEPAGAEPAPPSDATTVAEERMRSAVKKLRSLS
jgi:division protein CdvB (Snf7/Vps24/ESCRT-III family)